MLSQGQGARRSGRTPQALRPGLPRTPEQGPGSLTGQESWGVWRRRRGPTAGGRGSRVLGREVHLGRGQGTLSPKLWTLMS